MLQQILEQMYIDPELLEELSEDQKQILFYKMRQEQVRRWKVYEEKNEKDQKNEKTKNKKGKSVDFLKGSDGCEWVWVMGEHKNDKSVEQIVEEEVQHTARLQAEAEAKVLREKEEAELHKRMEEERQRIIKENEEKERELKRKQEQAALYQSLKEAKLAAEKMEQEKKRLEEEEKKRLAEIAEQEKKAKRRSREFAHSMQEKRNSEIYSTLQKKRHDLEKLAEENSKEMESSWKEQEIKAKEAEKHIRDVARQARVEYKESLRRSFTMMQAAQALSSPSTNGKPKPPLPPKKHLMVTSAPGITSKKPRPLRPKGREMIIGWFQKEEMDKGSGKDPETGEIAPWFHGIINRSQTEQLLNDKPSGSFLVRVSERVWGYTLSLKEGSRFKHFLIDASDLGYQFFGADQTIHASLFELVKFHKENAITVSSQEKLVHPCEQNQDPPDYWDLFHRGKTEVSAL